MPYNVKLKNQAGEEIVYSGIEQLAIPREMGTENAFFMARYNVTKPASANITYYGGDTAANSVDYMCRISTGATGKHVPTSISVKIDGKEATANVAYVYTKISNTEATVKVNGAYITGAITILAEAVTPS